ncbi:hypothetical protein C469_01909 [Halorubrum lipolyticum DSM 21995]|uniref:Uncharacterized protein n=1 Tax=Halorubrum lipolyticum DSM 21995 TaxID=1227482 RepID=M0P130_9EURY|nr:hypothetical protein C469_01909 [Halorubrum lipolyticum DSM 21995]
MEFAIHDIIHVIDDQIRKRIGNWVGNALGDIHIESGFESSLSQRVIVSLRCGYPFLLTPSEFFLNRPLLTRASAVRLWLRQRSI